MRQWLEISLEAPAREEEAALLLFEATGRGVVEEPGRVVGYLPGDADPRGLMDAVSGFLTGIGTGAVHYRRISEEDWAGAWREHFVAGPVSPRLFIRPPGDTAKEPAGAKVIEIRPSRAFGTGGHPTTRMCLGALDSLMEKQPGATVLDVGTGSGILAIAAALLGAKEVLGIDVDPVALEVAGENVAKNRVAGSVRLSDRPLKDVAGSFSVVLANLTSGTLAAEAENLAAVVEESGCLVASGILEDQSEDVARIFAGLGLTLTRTLAEGEWRTLTFEKI